MSAPLTNALLLKVTGPSDQLTAEGDPVGRVDLWTGVIGAYITRERRSRAEGSENRTTAVDVLYVLDTAGGPQSVVAGGDWEAAQVTVQDCRSPLRTQRTWTVNRAEHRATGSIADSIKLELSAETPST